MHELRLDQRLLVSAGAGADVFVGPATVSEAKSAPKGTMGTIQRKKLFPAGA